MRIRNGHSELVDRVDAAVRDDRDKRPYLDQTQSRLPFIPDLPEAVQVPEAELKYYLLFPKFLGTL
jgi:hypothetical protein